MSLGTLLLIADSQDYMNDISRLSTQQIFAIPVSIVSLPIIPQLIHRILVKNCITTPCVTFGGTSHGQSLHLIKHETKLCHDYLIIHLFRLTLVLSCAMNFKNYPHDTQVCNLKIESSKYLVDLKMLQRIICKLTSAVNCMHRFST